MVDDGAIRWLGREGSRLKTGGDGVKWIDSKRNEHRSDRPHMGAIKSRHV